MRGLQNHNPRMLSLYLPQGQSAFNALPVSPNGSYFNQSSATIAPDILDFTFPGILL